MTCFCIWGSLAPQSCWPAQHWSLLLHWWQPQTCIPSFISQTPTALTLRQLLRDPQFFAHSGEWPMLRSVVDDFQTSVMDDGIIFQPNPSSESQMLLLQCWQHYDIRGLWLYNTMCLFSRYATWWQLWRWSPIWRNIPSPKRPWR